MDKKINKIYVIAFGIVFFGISFFAWFKPSDDFYYTDTHWKQEKRFRCIVWIKQKGEILLVAV